MNDPSFILNGSGARDLRELARDLQALVDTRTAAMADPITRPDSSLPLDEQDHAPAGHRVGTGTTSILPYLVKSLASKPAGPRG